jgi:hypothetical protein
LLDGSATFRQAVDAAAINLGPPNLAIELDTRTVHATGRSFCMPPAELALLAVFARRAMTAEPPLGAPQKTVHDLDWGERYLRELRKISSPMRDLSRTERALSKGMDGDYFSQRLAKMRKFLEQQLGKTGALPYSIDDGGKKPYRYSLAIEPHAVRIGSGNCGESQVGEHREKYGS